ncbi:MAG: hypothetical protein K6C12_06595 [Oscillospiraceae bacterium]|nr:hypothetical protein [Oscillospiraceae bacterium]
MEERRAKKSSEKNKKELDKEQKSVIIHEQNKAGTASPSSPGDMKSAAVKSEFPCVSYKGLFLCGCCMPALLLPLGGVCHRNDKPRNQ